MNNYYHNSSSNANGGTNSNQPNPLSFPSYNSSQITPRIHEKPSNASNLSNLKHRLPLPQESQHHQTSSISHHAHHLQPPVSTSSPPHPPSHSSSQNSPLPTTHHGSDTVSPAVNHSNLNAILTHSTSPTSSTITTNINNNIPGHMSSNPESPITANNLITVADKEKPKKERKNRPGQKFGAKKKSWVWSWFIQDSTDPNIAACDYCGKVITRLPSDKGSPKKLSEHLKTHKLDKDSINHTRPIPIDGNGNTYGANGAQLTFSSQVASQPSSSNQSIPPNDQVIQSSGQPTQEPTQIIRNNSVTMPQSIPDNQKSVDIPSGMEPINNLNKSKVANNNNSNNNNNLTYSLTNTRRYLSVDFENSPYTPMKFQKHLLKFLTDNKLSIHILKSQSFQQLIYDLRSDSIVDLEELINLYSSLIEVSRFDNSTNSIPIDETNLAQTLAQSVEQKGNIN